MCIGWQIRVRKTTSFNFALQLKDKINKSNVRTSLIGYVPPKIPTLKKG